MRASLALVQALARRIPFAPVLLLATYRPEEAGREHPLRRLRRTLRQESLSEVLVLDRLDAQAVAAALPFECAGASREPNLAGRLHAASEGNPLFLELLYRQWLAADRTSGSELPGQPPEQLQELILQRLERLSPAARDLAEIAATVGPTFDIELVSEASGWEEAQALEALEQLMDHHLVREAGRCNGFDYLFAHHLIPAVIYAQISPVAARKRHRRVAGLMETLYPERVTELAGEIGRHYDRGGCPRKAIEFYRLAARRNLSLYADQEALDALNRALQLADTREVQAAPRDRFELLALQESILRRQGKRTEQQAALERLTTLAEQMGEAEPACDTLRRWILLHRALGARPQEAECVAALARQAEASADPHWRAEAQQADAAYLALTGQYAAAQEGFNATLHAYRALGEAGGQLACLCQLAEIAVHQGRFAEAQAHLAEARRMVDSQTTNHSMLVQTLCVTAAAAFAAQDFPTARTLAENMLEHSRRIGDREGEADAHARLAATANRQFRIQAAQEHFEIAGRLYKELAKKQGQAAVFINRGVMETHLGRYAAGVAALQEAERLFTQLDDLRGRAVSALNLGMAAYYQGDLPSAKAAAERGLGLAIQMDSSVMQANALANLGAAERELGEFAAAIDHMQAGLTIHRTLGQQAEVGTDLCDLAAAQLAAGDPDAAERTGAEMLTLYQQSPDDMVHPQYMLWVAGQIQAALGHTEQASELRRAARTALQSKAGAISAPELRASFLELPFNRAILNAQET